MDTKREPEQELVTLGGRLAYARKLRGLNQVELGKAIGVKKSSISQAENGRSKGLKPDNLLNVADALRISVHWLVFGSRGEPWEDDDGPPPNMEAIMATQLHPREIALVHAYRSLPEEQRLAVRNLIDTLAASLNDGPKLHEARAHAAAIAGARNP